MIGGRERSFWGVLAYSFVFSNFFSFLSFFRMFFFRLLGL